MEGFFCIYLDDQVFFSLLLLICCNTFNDLHILNHPCILGMKPTWLLLGSRYSWGRWKVPRLTPKPDPWFMNACQTSLLIPLLVSLLEKSQEPPVTQLARHVDLFHLVTTDNWRQETLSLHSGLAPPIKHATHSSQAVAPWSRGGQPSSL
jgi:hypothetical protein